MAEIWDQARIQRYIDDQVQESLNLEYKAAGALDRTDRKKPEITKDVSAMANSAGGTIIYGVTEKNHLPERIDPVDRAQFSHEWLEHVINNIQPRIDGLVIHPVQIDTGPNDTVHVVEIPQSTTAHQAMDKRYYKRFNFESVPMDDYEIRDVMGRQKYPKFALHLKIGAETVWRPDDVTYTFHRDYVTRVHEVLLIAKITNVSSVAAYYVNCFFDIPSRISSEHEKTAHSLVEKEDVQYCQYQIENVVRDVLEESADGFSPPKYGPSRYKPLLPGVWRSWIIRLSDKFFELDKEDLLIGWTIVSDSAPASRGVVALNEIEVEDQRDTDK